MIQDRKGNGEKKMSQNVQAVQIMRKQLSRTSREAASNFKQQL